MATALAGIRVLDLTRSRTAPFSTQILADFGAEVIKIEPEDGEPGRHEAPIIDGNSAYFYSVNRNKKSIIINLKSASGVKAFKQLVSTSDVVIHNFRPGVMERLGLGYHELRAINKGIIYCALSGYGATGPCSQIPGHDINFQAISGLLGLTGTPDGRPAISQVPLAGFAGGTMYAVVAVLLALFHRQRTGEGQFCDVAMLDAAISYLSSGLAAWTGAGELPKIGSDSLTGGYAYYNIYRTADNRYLALGAIESKFWIAICQLLERSQYIEQQFNAEQQSAMINDFNAIFARKTMAEWLDYFAGHEVCLTPVLSLEEAAEHPQVQARRMMIKASEAGINNLILAGSPLKMSATPPSIKLVFSEIGEHNEEILKAI